MKRLHAVAGLAAWPLVLASSAAAQEPSGFEWRVKDRFRLFDQASQGARDKVDALLAELQASDAALAEHYDAYLHVLSDAGQAAGHPAELRRSNYRPAGDEVGRTSGRYDERYLYPDSYAVELRNTALTGRTCSYYAGLTERTAPCGEWAAVTMPSGNGAERYAGVHGQVLITIDDGRTLSEPIAFRDETIVALGDSFISGEGNPDRPSMLNPDDPEKIFERPSWGGKAELGPHVVRAAQWWDEPCHRSLLSWPVLASLAYAALDERRAVTLVHLGCSGAVVDDLIAHGEVDLPGGGDETESQLQLLDGLLQRPTAAWRRREVDKVLLSIGGNDIGFVGVLTTLTLPPNGYLLGPLGAKTVGSGADAICPYDRTGTPLAYLCSSRTSAQSRVPALHESFEDLKRRLEEIQISTDRVYHAVYPNPLVCDGGVACDTDPANDRPKIDGAERPSHTGFEALMGIIRKVGRGPFYPSWNFEIAYRPEKEAADLLYSNLPAIKCDALPEESDSEVCQGLLVHYWLNDAVVDSGFEPIRGHLDRIAGHGLAMEDVGQSRALPRSEDRRWMIAPGRLEPYRRFEDGRWFRLPNDSIQTQFHYYGSQPRFHHGTVHPTYRAHLEYAQAALDEALLRD